MASLVINGDTSGGITLSAPAVAGSNTQTLVPASGTLAPLVSETAKPATGTSVEFTGIPSWVRRVTVMFNGVSTNGASNLQVQLGSGSYATNGYASVSGASGGGTQFVPTAVISTGMAISNQTGATAVFSGHMTFTQQNGNAWVQSHVFIDSGTARSGMGGGNVTLAGTLDRLRIIASATASPADTFDAGSINILYE